MNYERLNRKALGCMYTATTILSVIIAGGLGAIYKFLLPEDFITGKIVIGVLILLTLADWAAGPYFRYRRYFYSINADSIIVREGFLWIQKQIVPIQRLHKISINKGPVDKLFGLSKVVVTTAGGDVTIKFLSDDKADFIADSLKNRINTIVSQTDKVPEEA